MGIEQDIKAKNFVSNFQKAMVNLYFTFKWWNQQTDAIFHKYDIQAQHFNILRILSGNNRKPKTVKEIKEVIMDKGSDVTRLVDKLVSMGLVHRELNPESRREMLVSVTTRGYNLSETISRQLATLTRQQNNLSEKEAIELNRLLDKVRGS
jgi:DNA-binding MarR family transcriptional regulator